MRGRFSGCAQTRLESARHADGSEAADVDHRRVVRRRLDRVAVVMHLHELVPAGGRASGRGQRRRLERFTEMEQDLPDRRRVGDEGDEADVAAAGGAREREGFGDSRDKLGPCDSRGVVGTARGIGGTLTPALSRREREPARGATGSFRTRGARRSCTAAGGARDRRGRVTPELPRRVTREKERPRHSLSRVARPLPDPAHRPVPLGQLLRRYPPIHRSPAGGAAIRRPTRPTTSSPTCTR